jgi:elongation factor 1-gamma
LKNLKNDIKTINTALEGKKYLVGDELTIADVIVASNLMYSLQTVLDGGFRKAMKNIDSWAKSVYELPAFVSVHGHVKLCDKALKPFKLVEEKKEEKKKEAPKEAQKAPEEKPAKVLDNVESLPPTPFDLFSFKTLYVNHPDKKGEGVDEWYKTLDWEGWSFWRLDYDIYEGEGAKEHITSNLLGGFINRAEHTAKYTFGRIGVFGDEPNL